jgi:hypothetical protein
MIQKHTKILFTLFLLLDIFVVGIFLMLFGEMNNQIAETVQNTDKIKTEIKKQETLSLMKTDIQNAQIYQTALDTFLVPKGGDVDFIKTLESIAATSSVKLQVNSVVDQPLTQASTINAQLIHVNINVLGQWKDVKYFVKLLETYPLKIVLNQASLSKFSNYQINGKTVPEWSGALDFTVLEQQ